jgi:hypothetical protein
MDSKKYIGMDVHKESISIAAMNGKKLAGQGCPFQEFRQLGCMHSQVDAVGTSGKCLRHSDALLGTNLSRVQCQGGEFVVHREDCMDTTRESFLF